MLLSITCCITARKRPTFFLCQLVRLFLHLLLLSHNRQHRETADVEVARLSSQLEAARATAAAAAGQAGQADAATNAKLAAALQKQVQVCATGASGAYLAMQGLHVLLVWPGTVDAATKRCSGVGHLRTHCRPVVFWFVSQPSS